jgi:hypothetical protein
MKSDQIGEVWKQVRGVFSLWKAHNDGAVRRDESMSAAPASSNATNAEHPVFNSAEDGYQRSDLSQHINS